MALAPFECQYNQSLISGTQKAPAVGAAGAFAILSGERLDFGRVYEEAFRLVTILPTSC
jgi:hypothetical protein